MSSTRNIGDHDADLQVDDRNVIVRCADGVVSVPRAFTTASNVLTDMVATISAHEYHVPLPSSTVGLLGRFLSTGAVTRAEPSDLVQLASAADFLDVKNAQEYACDALRHLLRKAELAIDDPLLGMLPPACIEQISLRLDRDTCAEMAITHPDALEKYAISRFRPGGLCICAECMECLRQTIDTLVQGARERCIVDQRSQGRFFEDIDAEYEIKTRDRHDGHDDASDLSSVSSIDEAEFYERNEELFVQGYHGSELSSRWELEIEDGEPTGIFRTVLTYAVAKSFHAEWKSLPLGCPNCAVCTMSEAGVDISDALADAVDKLCVCFAYKAAYVDLFDNRDLTQAYKWNTNAASWSYLHCMMGMCARCGLVHCPDDFMCKTSSGRTRRATPRYREAVAQAQEWKRTQIAALCARPVNCLRHKKGSGKRRCCSVCNHTISPSRRCSCCSQDCCRNVECQEHYPLRVDVSRFNNSLPRFLDV